MKILTLAIKDVKLLVRDRSAMFWVLVFPVLIAIVFGSVFGGSNGANKISVALIDQDHSPQSTKLIADLKNSKALSVSSPQPLAGQTELDAAKNAVRKGDLAAYVLVPPGFGKEVERFSYEDGPALRLGIDPSRQAEAGALTGVTSEAAYKLMGNMMTGVGSSQNLNSSLAEVNNSSMNAGQKQAVSRLIRDAGEWQRVSSKAAGSDQPQFEGPRIAADSMADSTAKPSSAFEITFPQALLWGLLGVISSFAIGLVKEREQGTLVRLKTSMSTGQILAGKALACLLSCLGVMIGLIVIGHLIFNVRLQSPLLFAVAVLSGSICVVGIMMLLSVIGRTEQAVSGSSWGVMILLSMFGGGMIPVFMMPAWMQAASNFSPLKWIVLSVEGAIWRQFTWQEMAGPCLLLVGIGAVTFFVGVGVLRARA